MLELGILASASSGGDYRCVPPPLADCNILLMLQERSEVSELVSVGVSKSKSMTLISWFYSEHCYLLDL